MFLTSHGHARTNDDAIGNQQSKESREFSQRWLNSTTNDGTPFARFNLDGKPTMGLYPMGASPVTRNV